MRHSRILAAAAAAIVITGCANMDDTQRRTATGAGVGALAGAVIGSATGGSAGTGAVVGAGVGALGTYIWSRNMENQRRSMEQATRGTGVGVTQTSDNQLKLEIPSDISFDTNSSDIRGAFRPLLDQFAQGLRDNPRTGKVTLRHGEIKNLGMPPMTMVFRVTDASMLAPFKPCDKVRFRVEQRAGAYIVTRMEAAR